MFLLSLNIDNVGYTSFMYNTVNKFCYLEVRLCIAIISSVIIVIADSRLNLFFPFRNYMDNSIYLFYYLYEKPRDIYDSLSNFFIGHKKLIAENRMLREKLFLKNSEMLLIDQYKQENCKLYALLNAPMYRSNRKLVAKIALINVDSCHQQAILNQGTDNDVFIGQPVITDVGVVGQVIAVNKNDSRILLISDRTHALPVKLKRNNVRTILMGRGYNSDLYAEYPGNIDVYIDDILVTSGLDGRFPEGYPVAVVSEIKISSEKDFTIIRARPIVELKNLQYSILIWE